MAKRVTGSYADLARQMEAAYIRIGRDVGKAHKIAVDAAYADAHENLGGRTKTAQLRRENHPYGRGSRTPKGRVRARRPDLPINVQTGRLQRGLYRRTRRRANLTINVIGVKKTPYSKYILSPDGTPRMRTRPLWRYVQSRFRARMLGLRKRVRKAS